MGSKDNVRDGIESIAQLLDLRVSQCRVCEMGSALFNREHWNERRSTSVCPMIEVVQ